MKWNFPNHIQQKEIYKKNVKNMKIHLHFLQASIHSPLFFHGKPQGSQGLSS